jgi:prepilin-type N-terminal cleavage/methylation domain-containing protein
MKDAEIEDSYLEENKRSNEIKNRHAGFSLIEVVIAIIIFLVVALGVFATLVYAINYNTGNNTRSQALAILQQKVEFYRSAKFTPTIPKTTSTGEEATLRGGTKSPEIITLPNGNRFKIQAIIDDDPFCPGVQPETPFCTTSILPSTLKEIKVTVSLDSPSPGWQTSFPATVILRRARAN